MTQPAFDDIPETALMWHRAGKGAALATVVQTWGSAPRGVGSQLAISGAAELAGSVSGGCVEGAVVAEALDALEDGQSRVLEYGVSDDEAFAVGLACGGTIRILVEPVGSALTEHLLSRITQARADRKPLGYQVNTSSWQRGLIGVEAAPDRFRMDQSGFDDDLFTLVYNPPLRMAVVGAVHIAQPLVSMAKMAGFDPFIVDPREAFGAQARFPDSAISNDWPDEALQAWGLDARTAVVTLSHDPKIDDPAILTALKSNCFYLGCLGSTRTHAKRVTRLQAAGISADQIARIHAPVGLDLGSKTPAEIAVSVIAQIIQTLRQSK